MLGDSTGFASFSVDDTGTAREFYEGVLGVEVRGGMEGMITLHLAGGTTAMAYEKGDAHQPATFTVLHFPVEDLPGTMDGLAAKGVTFLRYPDIAEVDDRGLHTLEDGALQGAWFTDPAGNIIGLMSGPAARLPGA
jgi:predicted enzyme related to lactoylglutathione lyase